jgi:hypothetical protein
MYVCVCVKEREGYSDAPLQTLFSPCFLSLSLSLTLSL